MEPADPTGSQEAAGSEGLRRRAQKGETKGGGPAARPPRGREPLCPRRGWQKPRGEGFLPASPGAAPNGLTCDIELAGTGIRL